MEYLNVCIQYLAKKRQMNMYIQYQKANLPKIYHFFYILDTGRLNSKKKFTSQCHVLEIMKAI